MFEFIDTPLDGVKIVRPIVRPDLRGSFCKLVHDQSFAAAGLVATFAEQYVSTSKHGVLRGMHFQTPPNDHAKIAYCLSGSVLDVVVDLRRRSPSFLGTFGVELDGEEKLGVYIPRGLAHGFLTLSQEASMLYLVETVHAPTSDKGVHWASIGFDWPCDIKPLTSPRDSELPNLDQFDNSF